MSWRKGQDIFDRLCDQLAHLPSTDVRFDCDEHTPKQATAYVKSKIPEVISLLHVRELCYLHDFLMYKSEMRTHPVLPTYHYAGGDRVLAVTLWLQKNIDLILAKQYA